MIRWSQLFLPTLREDPKDAEAISHKLMLRAGLVRRLGSGAYSYLPLGHRVLQKVIGIIRDEMNAAGAQEVLLPALQPVELWKTTGRDAVLGQVLFQFKDRTGKAVVLGPTHEEVITSLMSEIKSHKQLPVTLYQIQTKFRDEPRPRFGVIRSKEFMMKDAYSFDVDPAGLGRSYQRMFEAYQRIFARLGVSALPCEADTGAMGGDVSHEFMAPAENGEDLVVRCEGCGYAANREAAKCAVTSDKRHVTSEKQASLKEVPTPGKHTVEQVSGLFGVPPSKLIKTLMYEADQQPLAVIVRGDHEVNETKVSRVVGAKQLKLAGAATIEKLTGAPVGFSGPVGLAGVKVVADPAAVAVVNAIAGANKADMHLTNVNAGRDYTPETIADLRFVTPDDPCARCGKPLTFASTIEVGHVFKLGTKYSQALGAVVQDAAGKSAPMIMGCYGIGVTRIIPTVIEQNHDASGIIWPPSIAPFQVIISVLEAVNETLMKLGEELAGELERAGIDVLLDDRPQSPGSKLKDADLIGIPAQVVIGKTWEREGKLEVVERRSKTRHAIPPSDLPATVAKLLDKPSVGQ